MYRIDEETLRRVICECIEMLCRHFFPNGKKVGQSWQVGNLAGERGRTLQIDLRPDKAGLWQDFSTGEGGDFVTMVMRIRSLDFKSAALEIGQVAGVDVTVTTMSDQPERESRRAGSRYVTSRGIKVPDWDRDFALKEVDITELATWRGYRIEFCSWAKIKHLIGRRKNGQWVFPVYDSEGKIVSVHIRFDKNRWEYRPKLSDLGVSLSPLIVGDPATATKIFFCESQWDGFAIADKLGIHYGEQIALVCTRSASNAALATSIRTLISSDKGVGVSEKKMPGPEFYVVPQNDEHGQRWARELGAILWDTYRLVAVPTPYRDANDWLRELKNPKEFSDAIRNAEVKTVLAGSMPGGQGPTSSSSSPPPRIYIECHRPSYYMTYQPPADLVLCGDNHIVRGGAFVVGGAPGVGKSRAITAFALAGALQVAWFGLEVHIGFRTLIIQNENGRLRLKEEFAAIDRPELEDHLLICPPPPYGLCFNKAEFRDQLRSYQDNFGPQAVIVDPWNAVAFDDRMKDYREAFDAVREVFNIGTETGPALGILAHTRKPIAGERVNGRALLSLLAGSYVLGSIPRCVFVMQSASDDIDDPRVVWTCCKNNDGKEGRQSAWERRNGLFIPVLDFDWEEFRNEGGHFTRKIKSTIDDLLVLIPRDQPISKEDLYAQAAGKVSRDDTRDYLAQLLREARIFIHKIPRPGKKSAIGYCQSKPPESEPMKGTEYDDPDEYDIDDDPR